MADFIDGLWRIVTTRRDVSSTCARTGGAYAIPEPARAPGPPTTMASRSRTTFSEVSAWALSSSLAAALSSDERRCSASSAPSALTPANLVEPLRLLAAGLADLVDQCLTLVTLAVISLIEAVTFSRAPCRVAAGDRFLDEPAVSLAAWAERCARLRTSSATTAKPMPASPARAASTAALSARMLVWNAISSIVLMMWRPCGSTP